MQVEPEDTSPFMHGLQGFAWHDCRCEFCSEAASKELRLTTRFSRYSHGSPEKFAQGCPCKFCAQCADWAVRRGFLTAAAAKRRKGRSNG